MGNLKDLVADVTADSTDFALNVGKWAAGSFTSAGVTWTGTAAFTVLQCGVKVTAAAAGGVCYIGSTATSTAIIAINCTSTRTVWNTGGSGTNSAGLKTADNSTITEFAAGASIVISADACAGKYFIFYIETPS